MAPRNTVPTRTPTLDTYFPKQHQQKKSAKLVSPSDAGRMVRLEATISFINWNKKLSGNNEWQMHQVCRDAYTAFEAALAAEYAGPMQLKFPLGGVVECRWYFAKEHYSPAPIHCWTEVPYAVAQMAEVKMRSLVLEHCADNSELGYCGDDDDNDIDDYESTLSHDIDINVKHTFTDEQQKRRTERRMEAASRPPTRCATVIDLTLD